MSNSIFPLPGSITSGSRGWDIVKYPVFNTIVQTPVSRRGETRISTTPYCTWEFVMTFPFVGGTFNDSTSYLNQLIGFYMSMQGAANSFLYDDPQDNTLSSPVTFGTGDGNTKVFQLTRPIGGAKDIIQNVNGTPSIYLNGVLQSSGYSINSLGVVTFTSAPASGAAVAWSGKYYFRCRFKNDDLSDLKQTFTNYWTIQQLEWSSVIL
jgi:hypothetical protein